LSGQFKAKLNDGDWTTIELSNANGKQYDLVSALDSAHTALSTGEKI